MKAKLLSETKNTWARDDPAILVLIGACLVGSWSVSNVKCICFISRFYSVCYRMVHSMVLFAMGSHPVRSLHDLPRLSPCRCSRCDYHLVRFCPLRLSRALLTCCIVSGSSQILSFSHRPSTPIQQTLLWSGHTLSMCTQMLSSLST